MNTLTMDQCPRWDGCSANYCPVDGGNVHLRDEATCYYMREALRRTPKDLFTGQYEGQVYEAANDHIALWDNLPSALKRDLKKAAKHPSRRVWVVISCSSYRIYHDYNLMILLHK